MDIEGTYTLQAPPETVWKCLMDPQVLRRTIPGVKRLEVLEGQKHSISLDVKQAQLMGSYQGSVTVTDQHYPYFYSLTFEGEGRQARFHGEGSVHLNGHGNNTVIAYKGTLNLGKLATIMPKPVVKGAVKMLIQQFFTDLAEEIRVLYPTTEEIDIVVASNEYSGRGNLLALPEIQRSPRLHGLVRLLGLGHGDPVEEVQWMQRVRRLGIVSGLLLLVWVGTRLPGKPRPIKPPIEEIIL